MRVRVGPDMFGSHGDAHLYIAVQILRPLEHRIRELLQQVPFAGPFILPALLPNATGNLRRFAPEFAVAARVSSRGATRDADVRPRPAGGMVDLTDYLEGPPARVRPIKSVASAIDRKLH